MMAVHLKVALHSQFNFHPAVDAYRAQHMIEESDPAASGKTARLALGQLEREANLRFGGVAFYKRLSDDWHIHLVPFRILYFAK